MWPFRPEKISDLFSDDDLRALLLLGEDVGTAVTLVEALPGGSFRSLDPEPRRDERAPDPFCTFLRHGAIKGERAFEGADRACAECEQSLARLALLPPQGFKGDPSWRRCHMGLTDFQAPVEVGSKRIASLVAGRVVREDAERERVRKIVSRLGTVTRAEAAAGRKEVVIRPLDDRARKRLVEEIAAIPIAPDGLVGRLAALAARLGDLAGRQFRVERSRLEDEFLRQAEHWPRECPATLGELSGQLSATLEIFRGRLGLAFLAFLARVPRDLDDGSRGPSLIAEAGLGLDTRRRVLELDWSRVPTDPDGERGLAARGKDTVPTSLPALAPTADAPSGLVERLAGSAFFAAVAPRPGREAGLFFGPAGSEVAPDEADYLFLARLAGALARRHYAIALEMDRARLADRIARRAARVGELEGTLAGIRAAEKEARETKGFSNFDCPKLVHRCVEGIAAAAAERGVEVDVRAVPDRLPLRARRELIADALTRLLELGLARSEAIREGAAPAPMRVFVRRARETVTVGVEAIGRFLTGEERRRLVQSPAGDRRKGPPRVPAATRSEPSGGDAPASDPASPDLAVVFQAARRHRGRFHIESERLERLESDPGRWSGRTTFLLELPAKLIRRRAPEADAVGD